ncbi:MAG: chorismate synthase [Acholeplasmataceae bacterium]
MNSYGTLFKVTLYGESHQAAIGVIVDGVKPGTMIDETKIAADMELRKPKVIGTTPRKEDDQVIITSGVFNGIATGSPIHLMIENKNIKSKDYENLKTQPRPGHADFVANIKYQGFQDFRGGGRFSGRLTAPLVAAGSIAKMMLPFDFSYELIQIGTLKDMNLIDEYVNTIIQEGESVGGIVQLKVKNVNVGLGEPFFEKLDAEIAKMMFSIPAVKGVEFGIGFEGVTLKGSSFNDIIIDQDGHTKTNHSGGITGGISNGNDIEFKVFVKPTSSIQKSQNTFNFESKEITELKIGGRHDVAIVRRIGIVLENALAIVMADAYLKSKIYQ